LADGGLKILFRLESSGYSLAKPDAVPPMVQRQGRTSTYHDRHKSIFDNLHTGIPVSMTTLYLQILRGDVEPLGDAKAQVVASGLSGFTQHVPSAGADLVAVLIFGQSAFHAKMV
jgi:hypothetical protein